ncbi:MAG TPA: hypothetical protein VF359_00900 [Anaerolineales bacterium]
MASHTIGQFGQHNWVILVPCAVTAQTPTHIHFLRLCNRHLANLSMAILTVETGCNVRTMAVIDKVRQNRYRYPFNGFVILNVLSQLVQFGTSFCDLLMTASTRG